MCTHLVENIIMCRFSAIIGLCIVISQWSIVISLQNSAIIKKLSNNTNRVSDGHRNTLTDVLKTENKENLSGHHKLRSKRNSDLSFYTPVASIRQEKVFGLVVQAFVNIIMATWRQGVPPLRPILPKEVVRTIKKLLTS